MFLFVLFLEFCRSICDLFVSFLKKDHSARGGIRGAFTAIAAVLGRPTTRTPSGCPQWASRGCAVAVGFFLGGMPSWAQDVYVAFDEQGQAHFAPQALDGRYQLLFKDMAAGALAFSGAMPSLVPVERLPQEVRGHMERAAQAQGIEYALLHALIQAESGFNAKAVSPKGAVGLMQLMPATARRYGVTGDDAQALHANLYTPTINLDAGTRYLRDLLTRFKGREDLALAAYNAGEGAVQRAGHAIPNYPETQNYVKKVLALRDGLRAQQGSETPERLAQTALQSPALPSIAAGPESAGEPAPRRTPGQTPAAGGPRQPRHAYQVQMFKGSSMDVQAFEAGFGR